MGSSALDQTATTLFTGLVRDIPRPTLALLLREIKQVTRNGEIKRVTRNGVLWDGIPFFVDPIGLQEAGVTMNSPVTVSSKAVPIRKALEDALCQLKLEYFVKDEDGFLLITSKESALPRPYP
jgi:hypothetical protein